MRSLLHQAKHTFPGVSQQVQLESYYAHQLYNIYLKDWSTACFSSLSNFEFEDRVSIISEKEKKENMKHKKML